MFVLQLNDQRGKKTKIKIKIILFTIYNIAIILAKSAWDTLEKHTQKAHTLYFSTCTFTKTFGIEVLHGGHVAWQEQ